MKKKAGRKAESVRAERAQNNLIITVMNSLYGRPPYAFCNQHGDIEKRPEIENTQLQAF